MRTRSLIAALAVATALSAGLPAVSAAQDTGGGFASHLVCVAPTDAAAIDGMLANAGSPLAGDGAVFVREGRRIGVDPRALVAIAAHETMLATYTPADRIRNAFGLGPGWSFPTHAEAIVRAATSLQQLYLPEGRIRIPDIGAKWAPIGAANDPGGLNLHWSAGVGTYYAALGGDPDAPILIDSQSAAPDCAAAAAAAPKAPSAVPSGPPVVTAWGGVMPTVRGDSPADGVDPATGRPAVIPGLVFPLAIPRGARADYADTFALPGPVACPDGTLLRCAVSVAGDHGAAVVAMVAGVLEPAGVAAREEGIAFWIATPDGDRIGYGPLAGYAPGVVPGAAVTAGQRLGAGAGTLRIAWERAGVRINPYPLLSVTRAPIA